MCILTRVTSDEFVVADPDGGPDTSVEGAVVPGGSSDGEQGVDVVQDLPSLCRLSLTACTAAIFFPFLYALSALLHNPCLCLSVRVIMSVCLLIKSLSHPSSTPPSFVCSDSSSSSSSTPSPLLFLSPLLYESLCLSLSLSLSLCLCLWTQVGKL